MSFYLNDKVKTIFADESIYKKSGDDSLASLQLPGFIKDWLIKKFTKLDGSLDKDGMRAFCDKHLPSKDVDIKARVYRREPVTVLARISIEIDIKNDCYRFGLPDLGIRTSEGIISQSVLDDNSNLAEGDIWGIAKLQYAKDQYDRGYIQMTKFQSFMPYHPNLDYYFEARKQFTTEEWLDFLIANMGYNPSPEFLPDINSKVLFLSRLLVFVEPNLNLIELAPKGTGKSYIFNNLSKHGWQISGGKVTRAKLFYDMTKRTPGLFANFDFVAMDEIKTISFDNPTELQGALKNYLEQGVYTVGKTRTSSQCGLILLGNISLDSYHRPISKRYFDELPSVFQDPALIDRFHGFIEGWKLPRLSTGSFFEGYSLNLEYFSEILSRLRTQAQYGLIVDDFLDIPSNADARDVKAIKKLCEGYLKLFFPHIQSKEDISRDEFKCFCFEPSFNKRSIIRRQLSLIDPEFKPDMPNIMVRG